MQSTATQPAGNTPERGNSQTLHTGNSVSNGTRNSLSNESQKSGSITHSPQSSSLVSKEASPQKTSGASSQIVNEEHQALRALDTILIDMNYETAMNNQADGLQTDKQKLELLQSRVQSWRVGSATEYQSKSSMLSAISDLEQSANYTIESLAGGAPNVSASDAAENYLTSASNEMNVAVSDIANGAP